MEWISANRYLNESEKKNNAYIVWAYLIKKGWSLNAIAGLLGNMEVESTINPGIWQSLNEGNMSGGFGLVQWTPATNFTDWADKNGYNWTNGTAQLRWISEVTTSVGQWIPTSEYPMSFEEFKTSTATPENLASAFLKNFERAGVEAESTRRSNALYWYIYLYANDPDSPIIPDLPDFPIFPEIPEVTKLKKKFNFILFNRNRRKIK